MAQGFLFRPSLLHGTILLCVPLFLSLAHTEARAAPDTATVSNYNGNVNAYRTRRIKARAESYQQRKQFPPAEGKHSEKPPDIVENKHYEPLKVTIPNLVESTTEERRGTRIVTRSSPSYKHLTATPHSDAIAAPVPPENAPITSQIAEAGDAVTSSISDAGRSLIAAIIPSSPTQQPEGANILPPPADVVTTEEVSSSGYVIEATQPPIAPVSPAETPPQAASDEAPFRYYSPGVIINKEVIRFPADPEVIAVATPEQLARLAPAAGEPAAGVDAPLIQIPSTTEPPPEQAPITSPTPTQESSTPEIKPLVAPASPPAPEPAPLVAPASPPAPEPAPLVAPASPPAPEPAPLVAPASPPAPEPAPLVAPASPPAPEPAPLVAPASPPAPEPAPLVAPASPPAPEPAPTPVADKAIPVPHVTHEQPAAISPKSKQILQHIPPIADEKPKEPQGVDIDRSKDTKNLFEAGIQDRDVSSDMAGVTIEVKAPSMNINYELEKAYNALLSGQNSAAIEIYKGVLVNDPTNEDALFGLATTYHRAGQIETARPIYGKLLAKNPTHRAALNNFLILVADESPQDAIMQLEALESKSPEFSPIPAQLAVIYQKLGDLGKASEKMFKAVSLAPENLTYRYNLAILMDKQRNFDEAIRLYTQIVQANSRGEMTPGNINRIQERLTFLRSNKH